MTLSEMADHVCGMVGRADTASVAKVKQFLAQRYKVIWDECLWKDSVWWYEFTFTPESVGPPPKPESWDGIFMLPNVADRLLGLRRTDQALFPSNTETLFRWSEDQFAQTGDPCKFVMLPPCVAILPTGYTYHDVGFYGIATDTAWTMTYIDQDNDRQVATGTSNAGVAAQEVAVVERITKETGIGTAVLTVNSGDTDLAPTATATATEFPLRVPIRLIPNPTAATTFVALIKKVAIPFDTDGASPELRGVDNCLMAFAHADLLKRMRQYGKANSVTGEAMSLLQQMKNVAVLQESHQERIVPEVTEVAGEVEEWHSKNYW